MTFGPTYSWTGALKRGPITTPPRVALTFDDGPSLPFTEEILDLLGREQVPATFFVIGHTARACPRLLERMLVDGHAIGNHTMHHRHPLACLPASGINDIRLGVTEIESMTGVRPRWFRPPWGIFWIPWLIDAVYKYGLSPVLWDVEALDFLRPRAEVIADRIIRRVRPGSVVLLHDGGGDRSETVVALPMIVSSLRKLGYHFVTLDGLLAPET